MSHSRKHLNDEFDSWPEPRDDQVIAQVVGLRGSNQCEVEMPDSRTTLALIPAKFRKKLWIGIGTFVIMDYIEDDDTNDKVRGRIETVLYPKHIKYIKTLNKWPSSFAARVEKSGALATAGQQARGAKAPGKSYRGLQDIRDTDGSSSSEDSLLQPNPNLVNLGFGDSDDDDDESTTSDE